MNEKIQSVLKIIEAQHNVQVIYACESGSRAWGFESTDSDWDIRFIYKRPTLDYLTIYHDKQLTLDHNSSEVIKNFERFELDFAGWDVKKALYQLSKGNPDLVSWLISPIVYKTTSQGELLRQQTGPFFKKASIYYHYVHMAKRNFNQYIENVKGEFVKRKKYLYVLRPLLNCMWVELFNSAPPMFFETVYENMHIVPRLVKAGVYVDLLELIALKRAGTELDNMTRVPSLDKFCREMLIHYNHKAVEAKKTAIDVDYDKLDQVFTQIII